MVAGGWLLGPAMARLGPLRRPGRGPSGRICRFGPQPTVIGAFAADSTVILISFAIAMAAVGSTGRRVWTGSVRIGGTRGDTAASILNTGGNGVGLLAPVVTPWVSDKYGWQKALLGLASVICLPAWRMWLECAGRWSRRAYSCPEAPGMRGSFARIRSDGSGMCVKGGALQ